MKLEIFIVFVISFELIVRISSAVIEHTDDCSDPVLHDDQILRRSGDRAMVKCSWTGESWFMVCRNGDWIGGFGTCSQVRILDCPDPVPYDNQTMARSSDRATIECSETGEKWFMVCQYGKWIGDFRPCYAAIRRSAYCSTLVKNKNEMVRRDGDHVTGHCLSNGAVWHLTCVNGQWTGERGICPLPISECPDPVLYDDQEMRRSGDRVMVRCSETGERFLMTCQDGEWIGNHRPCSPVLNCTDPVLYGDQSLVRLGDTAMIECPRETWYLTCQNGEWIGVVEPCSSGNDYCLSAPMENENEIVHRDGDHATVQCLTNGAKWHLTCVNGQWTGERGICPLPNCTESKYDENIYEIIRLGNNSYVAMVACKQPNPDGRRKAWYIGCRDDEWFGYVGECDGKPH